MLLSLIHVFLSCTPLSPPIPSSSSVGNAGRYDCASLVGYLLATGDFHEPTTR